ncbi:MAG: 1-deoxy-D-xylulose-5-phosphate reductoisomerase [Prevotellaceae bacterium]|jgi:1-deoxy-D-xylulose-5-phosphate reductoisomerase|nr:1-deoxy-D-xylulose-5-phosphate reductoisomerase [Prevotellaceae bacterium]
MKKRIAVLGSTGSIGKQALEVIAEHPDLFAAEVLTAYNNVDLLVEQAVEFLPDAVAIANECHYDTLRDRLRHVPVKVYAGADAVEQLAEAGNVDIVLSALVGFAGLAPTVRAIRAGKTVALANKETLVAAGSLVTELAARHNAPIVPVDSEHSAIFQCLMGESSPVSRLYLTASGGPFLDLPAEKLATVTVADALRHPRWSMGAKITVDSATMMNKGFEVIEACRLFDVPADKVEVLVHPQSVIHSMVQFADGAVKAQLGEPSMKVPIQYAFTCPERICCNAPVINFADYPALTFAEPDAEKFPCLGLAYEALRTGGTLPCVMNAANEVAVRAFLDGIIKYTDIYPLIAETMAATETVANYSLDDLREIDAIARKAAVKLL